MGNHLLSPIVELIHMNNTVITSLEGYVKPNDLNSLYTNLGNVEFGQELQGLNPGLYRCTISGTQYCFALHDAVSGREFVRIDSEKEAYIFNNDKLHLFNIYKINNLPGSMITEKGNYMMPKSINDKISMLTINGQSRYTEEVWWSKDLDNPYELLAPSTFEVKVSNDNGETFSEYIVSMKNYLKSVGNVSDLMIMEPECNRTSFTIRTSRQILSGQEDTWEKLDVFSNDVVSVYRFPSSTVKIGSETINCSHLNSISWSNMTNKDLEISGICAGGSAAYQGVCVKLLNAEYEDLDAFLNKLKYWFTVTADQVKIDQESRGIEEEQIHNLAVPFTIEYIRTVPEYKTVAVDGSNIPTFFGTTILSVGLYKSNIQIDPHVMLNDIVVVVPKNGIVESSTIQEQISGVSDNKDDILTRNYIWDDIDTLESIGVTISYFYKHYRW